MNRPTKGTEDGPGNTPDCRIRLHVPRRTACRRPRPTTSGSATTARTSKSRTTSAYGYDALDRLIDEAFITNAEQILGYDSTLPSDVRQWASYNDQYSYDLDSNQVDKRNDVRNGSIGQRNGHVNLRRQRPDLGTSQHDHRRPGHARQHHDGIQLRGRRDAADRRNGLSGHSGQPRGNSILASSTSTTSWAGSQWRHGDHVHQRHAITNRATDLRLRHKRRSRLGAWTRSIANADGTWDTQTLTEYLNDSNNFTGYTQVLRATQTDPNDRPDPASHRVHDRPATNQPDDHPLHQRPTRHSNNALLRLRRATARCACLMNAAGAIATIAGVSADLQLRRLRQRRRL